MDIHQILKKRFGFDSFRTGQEEVVRDVIAGKDTVAILPTGSGKSLCYQLPAYVLGGVTLIISPLVALMEDQVAIMKRDGEKRVVALNSFLTFKERQRIIGQLDTYKFIFISPEMLVQKSIADQIGKIKLELIVVDEAHCISQWGFDFRPDYLRIGVFLKQLNRPSVLALTATADDQVLQDIVRYLKLDNVGIHKHSLDRPNISYAIKKMDSEQEKTDWIIQRVNNTIGPGIIYVVSRKRADELASLLKEQNVSAASYHAGMEQEDRSFIQEQFISNELDWICATNAFGMGIHKNNVRQIIHENVPATIAGYVQEIGRAGRDGNLSIATLLFTPDDVGKIRFIIQNDLPKKEEILQFSGLLSEQVPHEEAAQLAGLSETGQRVVKYYLERMPVEEVLDQFENQSIEKERQLQMMVSIINAESCIRQSVLNYFNETLLVRPTSCCSVCENINTEWLFDAKKQNSTRGLMHWSKRLALLLG